MSDIAIRVEGLGKRYRIGAAAARHDSFRQAMAHAAMAPFRNMRRLHGLGNAAGGTEHDSIWALRDVSFEVRHGEVLGIIGRNGAGKSTLLKILSRITDPTRGRVEIHGRVGALLEVGTGFHPELTGRDNIYLNGSILGMDRAYIDRKFDEIVEFSGVAKFIDTPVKRYSSGMYLRLAFSVAAHLEPAILVIDEVLAVGDADFQKRCLGKMREVARDGRTVLFVSHNMGAVQNLCPSVALLKSGRLTRVGTPHAVLSEYLSSGSAGASAEFPPVGAEAYYTAISVSGPDGRPAKDLSVTDTIHVRLRYTVQRALPALEVSFSVYNRLGTKVFYCPQRRQNTAGNGLYPPGQYEADVVIPAFFLTPGVYTITAGIHQPNVRLFDVKTHAVEFHLLETGSPHFAFAGQDLGLVFADLRWNVRPASTQ